ncbi:HutD family protein [Pectinatus frisingensis]|jgi:environmental stress-induced protein Ves|uniref:HutD/Ves family protein n=1 Tax=Pectinatus frisingensis TaxID=865 RepID=UPI0018C49BC2|nr:HutD family protein [Pectinatus frisingensis]
MAVEVFLKENYTVTDWSGGTTTQMYIFPENAEYNKRNFKLRLSSATVKTPVSEFTDLKNIDRILMSLNKKIELEHNKQEKVILKPFEAYYFSGGDKTMSYGCCEDFNVMLKHGSYNKAKLFLNEAGQFDLYGDADECFLYVYKGEYKVITQDGSSYTLQALHMMHLDDFSAGKIIRLDMQSKMVVFKINW